MSPPSQELKGLNHDFPALINVEVAVDSPNGAMELFGPLVLDLVPLSTDDPQHDQG